MTEEPFNMATLQEENHKLKKSVKRLNAEKMSLDVRLHDLEQRQREEIIEAIRMTIGFEHEGHPFETIIRRVTEQIEKQRL